MKLSEYFGHVSGCFCVRCYGARIIFSPTSIRKHQIHTRLGGCSFENVLLHKHWTVSRIRKFNANILCITFVLCIPIC